MSRGKINSVNKKISTQEADEPETVDKHEELNYDSVVRAGRRCRW